VFAVGDSYSWIVIDDAIAQRKREHAAQWYESVVARLVRQENPVLAY
jgi:hypothetical protein